MTNFYNLYLCLISYILTKYNSNGQNYLQTSSPCPNIFQHNSPGYGEIQVPSPQIGEMLLLQVEFIVFGRLASQDVGSLNLSRSQQETLQLILNGAPYINYILRFPQVYDVFTDAPPQIIRIYYNKNVICSGSTDDITTGPRSTVKLQNLLYSRQTYGVSRNPFNNGNNIVNNRPEMFFSSNDNDYDRYNFAPYRGPTPYQPPQKNTFEYPNNQQRPISTPQPPVIVQRPFIQVDRPNNNDRQRPLQQPVLVQQRPFIQVDQSNNNEIQRPSQQEVTSTPTVSTNFRDDEICGVVDQRFRIIPLVYGGDNIIHGTWPWLAAIFISNSHSLNYQCGGSLVSNRVVVSAAHCLINGGSPIAPTKVNVHLGRHNLNIWEEEGQQRRQVSLVKVHDDYMRTDSFDADIGLIVLKRVVEYTAYVRPICLWSGNTDLRQVEGQLGTVVGWGLTELGSDDTEPKTIDIPIVSQEVCLRNSADSFKRITSDRTFCAGFRNGTGPCNGDSGSGMALQQDSRWRLRGVVSVSAATDTIHRKCDLRQYVVFTDAARFSDFIRQYINY